MTSLRRGAREGGGGRALVTPSACLPPARHLRAQSRTSCTADAEQGLPRASRSWANTLAYRRDATPVVTSVAPRRGSTAGGTVLTLVVEGLPASASPANVEVSVVGLPCTVQSVSGGEVVCTTASHGRTSVRVFH